MGLNVKIVIGITEKPETVRDIIAQFGGNLESLTEVGPFLSIEEALEWLNSLKAKINDIVEIPVKFDEEYETVLYGFTFEKSV